jgi:hypothetical protein
MGIVPHVVQISQAVRLMIVYVLQLIHAHPIVKHLMDNHFRLVVNVAKLSNVERILDVFVTQLAALNPEDSIALAPAVETHSGICVAFVEAMELVALTWSYVIKVKTVLVFVVARHYQMHAVSAAPLEQLLQQWKSKGSWVRLSGLLTLRCLVYSSHLYLVYGEKS